MKYKKHLLLLAVALFAVNPSANAAPYPGYNSYNSVSQDNAAYRERITLEFYASKYFSINKKIKRVFVGSGDIIQVKQPANSPNEFVITAKEKKGSTTLFVWTADGERYEYLINVVDEEIGQAEIIQQAINLPNVHVKKVGDRILLTGTVKNQYERNYALQTAGLYVDDSGKNNLSVGSNVDLSIDAASATSSASGTVDTNTLESTGKIIDLLEMETPLQIRLEAQVVEISTDKAKDLGIRYGMNYTDGIFQFGEDNERTRTITEYYHDTNSDGTPSRSWTSTSYTARNTPFRENPGKWIEEHFAPINAQINALVQNGDARILSRPNVTTMSGEQATIRIGGDIPYSTVSSNGQTNVSFREYGIILRFKPIIDSQNRITAAVHTEISSLSGNTVDGQPILNTRSADSVVNIYSGSTMVIGGLMDSSETKRVQKVPLLGDIPILGEFFKYTSKSRDKRELIVVITPHIIGTEDTTHARVSDDMRDFYYAGQREVNNYNDLDLNALPPPLEDDKDKKDKKKKKYTKDNKSNGVVISDYPSEDTSTNTSRNTDEKQNVEVFENN